MSSTRDQPTKSSRSFRTNPIILDLTNDVGIFDNTIGPLVDDEKIVGDLVPPSPTYNVILPPGKALRRKKNMSVTRASLPPPPSPPNTGLSDASSLVPASPAPEGLPRGTAGQITQTSVMPNIPCGGTHHRTQSQPTPGIRLGHPSRPYYSAIRPRPTSVIGLSPSLPVEKITPPNTRRSSLNISPPDHKRFTEKRRSFLDVQIQDDGDVVLPTPSALSPPATTLSPTGDYGHHQPFGLLLPSGLTGLQAGDAAAATPINSRQKAPTPTQGYSSKRSFVKKPLAKVTRSLRGILNGLHLKHA